jgi:hypothetical protein
MVTAIANRVGRVSAPAGWWFGGAWQPTGPAAFAPGGFKFCEVCSGIDNALIDGAVDTLAVARWGAS